MAERMYPCRITTLLWLFFASCISEALATSSGIKEYCQWEDFTASCGPRDVIVMGRAHYGRMKMGRCVEKDFGYLGCQTDVLSDLDSECSGKQECRFAVTTLHDDQDCPKDLTAYLRATYTCVKVTPCIKQVCQTSQKLTLTNTTGTLASITTSASGCGSHACPWLIQAKDGQRINVTLMDFAHRGRAASPRDKNVCRKFATVTEGGRNSEITACGGRHIREQHAYLSKTSTIQIQIHARPKGIDPAFLINYEVIGCPDITPPAHAQVEKTADGNEAEVRCLGSEGVWHLTCQGNSWVGPIGTCQEVETGAVRYGGIFGSSRSSPVGVIVVIGLGVALGVAIGVTLLLIALAYMKRKSYRRPANQNGTAVMIDSCGPQQDQPPSKVDSVFMETCPLSRREDGTFGPDNSYISTLYAVRRQQQDTPSDRLPNQDMLMDLGTDCSAYNEPCETLSREHVYETPNFPIQNMRGSHVGDTARSTDGLFREGGGRMTDSNSRTN